MRKACCIIALFVGLGLLPLTAQNDLDSTLVVTEIASEDTETDTTACTTWTFNNVSDSCDVEVDDAEEFFKIYVNGVWGEWTENMGKLGKAFEKFGWVLVLIPLLLFLVLPILLILLIVFIVQRGRKAKDRAYGQRPADGKPEAASLDTNDIAPEDTKLRNDGVRNICVGIGLAILLGIIMGEVGVGIGALVACIGVGKYVVYWMGLKDKKRK